MTREQRNIKLKHLIACMKCEANGRECDANCPTQYEAGNMGEIIENLEAISEIIEQQPCEDCISRRATVERLCKVADFMNEKREGLGSPYIMAALFIQDNKDEFPPVTPKEKTGHWTDEEVGFDGDIAYRCSNCNELFWLEEGTPKDNEYNFCPNCGARMVEPQESE